MSGDISVLLYVLVHIVHFVHTTPLNYTDKQVYALKLACTVCQHTTPHILFTYTCHIIASTACYCSS